MHGLAGALGQALQMRFATPMMSMLSTMPLDSSNIFKVSR